jgi:hypothetical protein
MIKDAEKLLEQEGETLMIHRWLLKALVNRSKAVYDTLDVLHAQAQLEDTRKVLKDAREELEGILKIPARQLVKDWMVKERNYNSRIHQLEQALRESTSQLDGMMSMKTELSKFRKNTRRFDCLLPLLKQLARSIEDAQCD